jgi:hypothetical protein
MHRAVENFLSATLTPRDSRRAEIAGGVIAVVIFSALSLFLAVKSTAFLEGDACTHYIYARAVFAEPYYLVNVWGRPFATALYAVPAHYGGRLAVRVTSLIVALVIALVSQSIARGQRWRWPVLALIFTLAQPLVFLHSFSELTELPFALLMALGFWAYQRRCFFLMALIVGTAPLSRPEGFAFVALAAIALLAHRRRWWLVVLAAPVTLWDYTGWRMYGEPGHWWHWLAENWPYQEHSIYTPGPLLHFVEMLPAVVSPFIFPATIVGIIVCLASCGFAKSRGLIREAAGGGNFFSNHRRRCDVLIALLPMAVLAGHSYLYWRGAMSSNGEVRYMLVVAPFWALLGARGWGWVFETFNWKRPLAFAAVAALLPIGVNWMYKVLPVVTMPDWQEAKTIAHWYETRPESKRYPYLASSHPALLYWLDMSPTNPRRIEWRKDIIDSHPLPAGTILIWDRINAMYNSDSARTISLDELRAAGWKPMPPSEVPVDGGFGQWHFFKSEPKPEPKIQPPAKPPADKPRHS